MKPRPNSLLSAFQGLRISSPSSRHAATSTQTARRLRPVPVVSSRSRPFSTTPARQGSWLEPFINRTRKMMKGRPRVATGGSVKGTTVMTGDYGLRMTDHHRRINAKQLQVAEAAIKARLRGQRYRLYKRVNCNIGVYTSGNEMRMGKGKGNFDHWATRVAVSRIIFELKGALHEQVARDAFRIAGNLLPGQYEFVKKGEPPIMGITKLVPGVTLEDLKRPRLPTAAKSTAPVPDIPQSIIKRMPATL